MKRCCFIIGILLLIFNGMGQPVSLHPENTHYFIFKGKPVLLITSAEHYGAVLNLDVDYKAYLNVLSGYGFNHTRVFSGAYCEGNERGFLSRETVVWSDIQNTLAPRPGRLISPWDRSDEEGYKNGGNKFDLDRWDDAYFRRLKDFCSIAEQKEIIVEIVLFTAIYTPAFWLNSPLNPVNNINNTENISYNEFHLLKNKALVDRQLKMVGKIVQELNEFDNVYFEICNEPYWLKGIPESDGSITEQQFLPEIDEWQALIAKQITKTEEGLPKRHLIAQNIANTYYKIKEKLPRVSVLNFHYAFPPTAVTDNYHLQLPVVFDETASGEKAPDRRKEAWAFILAGGAGYSNLDWSYATDDPTGLDRNPAVKRTSGKKVREQLHVLKTIVDNFDYIHAQPFSASEYDIPPGLRMHALKIAGKAYLYYFYKEKKTEADMLSFPLDEGKYTIMFIDPVTGKMISKTQMDHKQGRFTLVLPIFSDDIVLKIERN